MDVLAKLKSTVGQYLPGNPLSKDYDIVSQHTASFGPGLYWKVFRATAYGGSKQEASVCLFEKRHLDHFSKADREYVLDVIRKGVQQLTKLRHPRILAVYHPLEETTSALAFATEPILCSLANKVRYPTDPSLPDEAIENMLKSPLHEVDIKFGFVQVCEGLSFLHNDAKIIHGNLCPENIILTISGDWKLAGFEFAITGTQATAGAGAPTWARFNWQNNTPLLAQPNLGYFAPEYRRNAQYSLTPASDMYSIGCLLHTVNNGGRPFLDPSQDRNQNGYGKWEDFIDRVVKNARWESLLKVPSDFHKHVLMLLSIDPAVRPDADQVIKLPFFQDVAVQTLQYLDTLVQRDLIQRSQFFRGLPKVIEKLPKHINVNRVLPPLFREFTNPDMVPFLLPPILTIAELTTQEEYVKSVFPGLSPAFKMVHPIQIPLILLQHMNLLLSKTPPQEVKNYVLPMAYIALETGNETVQELCLNTLPTVSSLIDYGTLKAAIIPRIKKLALETNQVPVKVKCMVCMAKLLECMDKWFVLDHVLPFLPQVKSSEPAVIMTILGIYKVALTDKKLGITKEALVSHCLPFLLHLSLETSINLEQYEALMALVRQMIEQVELEQRTKLQQLALLRDQHATLTNSMNDTVDVPKTYSTSANSSPIMRPSASSQNIVPTTNHLLPSSVLSSSSSSGNLEGMTSKLSLEDKERMAAAQKIHNRINNEPAPVPIPVSSNSSRPSSGQSQPMRISKPKDLTSTLIERELASIAVQMPATNSGNAANSSMNFGAFPSSGPSQSKPPVLGGFAPVAPATLPSFPNNANNNGFGSFTSAPTNQFVGNQTPFPAPPSGFVQQQNQQNLQTSQQKGNKDLLDFLG